MSGRIAYSPSKPHRCEPPDRAEFGTVWQCDCGRRWTCRKRPLPVRGMVSANPCTWERRYWPWPRLSTPPVDRELCAMLDVDPAEVERLIGPGD